MNRELLPSELGGAPPEPATVQFASAPPVLLQYWRVIRQWKWIILGIVAASLVGGLLLTFLATPQYTAVSRVEISREEMNITDVKGLESERTGQDLEFFQTQYALLEARSLAERVAKSLNLGNSDAFWAAHAVAPESLPENQVASGQTAGALADARNRRVLDLLLKHVEIKPVRGSALVDVEYTSADPELSAQISNAWSREFISGSVDRRFASTLDAREFLTQQLNDLRGKLEESERAVANYAAEKGIVPLASVRDAEGNTTAERTLVSDELERLNAALAEATAQRIAASGTVVAGANSQQALTNATLNTLRERRAGLAADYSRMLVQFEPEYPAARAIKEQMDALDRAIASEEARVRASSAGEYRAAVSRERQLQERVAQLQGRLGSETRDSIQYNIYQREADTNRQLYEALLQRYKEIGVAGVEATNISIIDVAEVPRRPSSPSLPLNLALAIVIGLALAAIATIALEQIDEGLREPNQIKTKLGIPLLGSVPTLEEGEALDVLQDVKSELSEAYLTVRSMLALATDHGVPRSFTVTSTRAAEGKTTSSIAIATVLGRTGKKVLLVDADMRSPSIAKTFGVDSDHGLANILSGDDEWKRYVHSPAQWPFDVLPAGLTPPNAAELLSSDRLEQLMRTLVENFDHVIVDAPPILGLADAPLISRSVESVIMVIEANGVAVRGLQSALGRLQTVHANVLGAVLTKFDHEQASYGYGYGYGYGYAYGKDEEKPDNAE